MAFLGFQLEMIGLLSLLVLNYIYSVAIRLSDTVDTRPTESVAGIRAFDSSADSAIIYRYAV